MSRSAAKQACQVFDITSTLPSLFKQCLKFSCYRANITDLFVTFLTGKTDGISMGTVNKHRHFTHALFQLIMRHDTREILVVCDRLEFLPFVACRLINKVRLKTLYIAMNVSYCSYYSLQKFRTAFTSNKCFALPLLHMLSGGLYMPSFQSIGQSRMLKHLIKRPIVSRIFELFNDSQNGLNLDILRAISKTLTVAYLACRSTSCTDLVAYLFEVHSDFTEIERLIMHLPPTDSVLYNHCARACALAAVLFYDLTEVDRNIDSLGFYTVDDHYYPLWY